MLILSLDIKGRLLNRYWIETQLEYETVLGPQVYLFSRNSGVLKYSSKFGTPQYIKNIKPLEYVQRRVAMMAKDPEDKTWEQQLSSLGFFCLEKTKVRGDLLADYNFLQESSGGDSPDLLSLLPAIGHKELEPSCIMEKFRLDIRKWFFTERVASHLTRLLKEMIMTKSLPEYKELVDDAFSHC